MKEIATDQLSPIQRVAKASGVSARTLRHYDDIGLLPPAGTSSGGVRMYGQAQLLRLQRILIMRELDLGLDVIREILDERTTEVEALRQYRMQVVDRQAQLDRLLATVDRTIEALQAGRDMSAAEIFDGFDAAKQQEYEAQLVERYGPQAQAKIDESWRRIGQLNKDQATEMSRGFEAVVIALTDLLQSCVPTDDDRVQALIAQHYAIVSRFWTPDAESYSGLGQMYVDNPDFRARYDAHDPRLAEYKHDAMDIYAITVLATS
ncbi:MAG: MerR family transcriptional regulator [Candidatus Nanopelagicales bacterium]